MNTELVKLQERTEEYKAQVQVLNTEISRLKTVIMGSPDPVELAEVRAHYEGLQRLLEEKDKRIEI